MINFVTNIELQFGAIL